jgi:hypothetical protein
MLDGQCGKGNGKLWIEAMGSYRRGEADSGDLDVLISRDTSDGKGGSSKFSGCGTVYETHSTSSSRLPRRPHLQTV